MADFKLRSAAFEEGAEVPARHTCEGEDLSPPLEWSGAPAQAASLALIVEDPDAPSGTFVHWLAWGIEPRAGGLGEGEAAPAEGMNGFGTAGYRGPCPPPGHGPHRYFFRLHALDTAPDLAPSASRAELGTAIEGHVLATAELVATRERRRP